MAWFLRRMVKRGFKRKNVPDKKSDKRPSLGELDWSYEISNARLRKITETQPIRMFCYKQQIKYIAHICRLGNNELQKQILFERNSTRRIWIKFENLLGLDAQQIKRTMMKKSDFTRLLDMMFSEEHPKDASASQRGT